MKHSGKALLLALTMLLHAGCEEDIVGPDPFQYPYSMWGIINPLADTQFVRDGAVLPHIGLAQSTKDLDWSSLDLVGFSTDGQPADGYVALPREAELHALSLTSEGGVYQLTTDLLGGQVTWTVTPYTTYEGR